MVLEVMPEILWIIEKQVSVLKECIPYDRYQNFEDETNTVLPGDL